MVSEQELDDRLASAKRGDLSAPNAFFDAMLAEAAQDRPSSRASRKAVVVAIVGALVVGSAALPAAAEELKKFLAQADFFPASGTEIIANSEFVDTSAPDFPEYLRATFWTDATLPPGMGHESLLERIIELHTANPGLTQEVGFRRFYEVVAQCGWMSEWRQATLRGDDNAVRIAAAQLQAAATWRGIVTTDGGGVIELYQEVASAVATGDAATVAASPLHRECQMLGVESR